MAQTVLIVDDSASFRAGARRLLEAGGYQVVGEAADGATGILSARELEPEVVLLDVHLPDMDGFQVSTHLTGDPVGPAVVLTSSRDGGELGELVSRAGARGFVAKFDLCGPALSALLA